MSTTIKSVIIPTYAAAAKKQPSVGAASASVAVSIPIPTAKQPTVVVSPSPNAVGSPTAYEQPSSVTVQKMSSLSSSNKTSIMKKENKKFIAMKICVSSNSQGTKCSKSPKVMSKVILSQKRKASSESLRNGHRRVARKARQEERKKEMERR